VAEARWPCSCCNYTVCRGAWHAGRTGSGPLSKLAGPVLACVRACVTWQGISFVNYVESVRGFQDISLNFPDGRGLPHRPF
jgi:hypothetical protein